MILEDLKNKRVLITGSSSGIGAAAALAFGDHGAAVAVHANRNTEGGQKIADTIVARGGTAVLVHGDLKRPDEATTIVNQAANALGGLDILVNNAGGLVRPTPLSDYPDDLLDEVIDLNIRSVLAVTRAAYPHLKAAGGGSIVNVGSLAGRTGGQPGSALYAGAKAFVHSLTKGMANEFAGDGIRVNTLAPGVIVTPFHDQTPEARLETVRATTPLKRLGEPEECAGVLLFLASPAMSGFVTGQTFDVNGGRLMP